MHIYEEIQEERRKETRFVISKRERFNHALRRIKGVLAFFATGQGIIKFAVSWLQIMEVLTTRFIFPESDLNFPGNSWGLAFHFCALSTTIGSYVAYSYFHLSKAFLKIIEFFTMLLVMTFTMTMALIQEIADVNGDENEHLMERLPLYSLMTLICIFQVISVSVIEISPKRHPGLRRHSSLVTKANRDIRKKLSPGNNLIEMSEFNLNIDEPDKDKESSTESQGIPSVAIVTKADVHKDAIANIPEEAPVSTSNECSPTKVNVAMNLPSSPQKVNSSEVRVILTEPDDDEQASNVYEFQPSTSRAEPQPFTFRAEPQSSTFRAEPQSSTFRAEPQPFTFRAEPQPSTFRAEPQPSTFRTEPQPSTFRTEPQPSTFRTEPQPSTFRAEPQPSTSRAEPHPSTSRAKPHPSTSRAEPHPSTSRAEPHPSTSRAEPHPSTSRAEPHPSTSRAEPHPSTSRAEPHPSTSRSEPHPSTSRAEPQPSTSRAEPQPSTSRAEPQPSTSRAEPQPSTSRAEPQPSTSRAEPQPSTSRAEPQPSTFKAEPQPSTSREVDNMEESQERESKSLVRVVLTEPDESTVNVDLIDPVLVEQGSYRQRETPETIPQDVSDFPVAVHQIVNRCENAYIIPFATEQPYVQPRVVMINQGAFMRRDEMIRADCDQCSSRAGIAAPWENEPNIPAFLTIQEKLTAMKIDQIPTVLTSVEEDSITTLHAW